MHHTKWVKAIVVGRGKNVQYHRLPTAIPKVQLNFIRESIKRILSFISHSAILAMYKERAYIEFSEHLIKLALYTSLSFAISLRYTVLRAYTYNARFTSVTLN